MKYAHAHDMKVQNLFFSSTLTYIRKLAHITQPAAYPQHSIANQAQVAVTHESLETVQFETDNLILSRDDIKLGKKIGNGTFGDVHEARLVSSNQQVAVKACKTSHSDAVKCQFLYEADIVRHYKHPNIVKLIGVVPHHEQEPLSIVMEFVGWTFQYFLQANGSKCETAVLTEMCAQVCTGMEYLERNNCVHRSLTARNCLVGENNIVKISNFGTCHGKIHLDPSDSKLRPAPVKWTAPEVRITIYNKCQPQLHATHVCNHRILVIIVTLQMLCHL